MESIKIKPELKSQQGMILTVGLKEALSILEMPLLDLAEWLQKQIEQNPALQFAEDAPDEQLREYKRVQESSPSFNNSSWIEEMASPPPSLYDHLMSQAREILSSPEELYCMEQLIGNLDEQGFLGDYPEESHLVLLLQSFDPPGIGARTLQHSLLLQLTRKGLGNSLAYQLVRDHYTDLLHGRKEILCKSLSCSPAELQALIDNILSSLNLRPAAPFQPQPLPVQIPDLFIEFSEGFWIITPNDSFLPKFTLNSSIQPDHFKTSAQWVEKMVSRRLKILTQITEIILEIQADFFHGVTSDLQPLSFKQVAEKLSLHESTVSRAVKEKYLSSPRGIYPLRFFFPHTTSGSLSHHTVKERLKKLIQSEDKQKPLSDEKLKKALQSQGISCARRTLTKYRQSLQIPPASHRKGSD